MLHYSYLFADLVPREVGEKWLKYFREELPTVAFKCSTQQQAEKLGRRKMPTSTSKSLDEGSSMLQVRGQHTGTRLTSDNFVAAVVTRMII